MNSIKAVVFDLDGTLLNTLTDLAASCNHALRQMKLPERTEDEIRQFVGNGARLLCHRAVGLNAPEEMADQCLKLFQADYNLHMNDHTAPYPGILDMLRALQDAGIPCAVVSNKYDLATKAICEHYFGSLISVSIGEGNGITKKPCPDGVNKALSLMGVTSDEALYVGDSDTDVKTAQNACLPCVGVTWGFRSREILEMAGAGSIVDSPAELLDIILQ